MISRIRHTVSALCLVLLLSQLYACALIDKDEQLHYILTAYERAIRWGNIASAQGFKKDPDEQLKSQLENLKNIRVTRYNVVQKSLLSDGMRVKQIVQINYYNKDTAIERNLVDMQEWQYDEQKEQWFLTSPIPIFN